MPPREPPVVLYELPVERTMQPYNFFTGRLAAKDFVEVRARASGYLKAVHFKDGQEIKEGDLLFEIDERPYAAALAQVDADIGRAKAAVEKKTADFGRTRELFTKGISPKSDMDQATAAKAVTEADVVAAQAKREQAQLNLDYCKVMAPISGEISRTLVTAGNLVVSDQTLLTTIVSIDPIQAYFDVDTTTYLRVQNKVRSGELKELKPGSIPVELALATDTDYPHKGHVDFRENQVDAGTGTLQIRAEFANPKPSVGPRILQSGMFVKVRVPIGEAQQLLTVAERAIGTDQTEKYVLIIGDKNIVRRQRVELGQLEQGRRVVLSGVKAGDKVIVSGLLRARPGDAVTPKPEPTAPTEPEPAGEAKSGPGPAEHPAPSKPDPEEAAPTAPESKKSD